jgi:hypothetical protein
MYNSFYIVNGKLKDSRYIITGQERIILLWLIEQIKNCATEFKIAAKELCELIGEKNEVTLMTITMDFSMKAITIFESNGEEKKETITHWINQVKYDNDGEFIYFSCNEKVKKLLVELEEQLLL